MSEDENERTGRTRVAVVFGGRSSEHAISCVTAAGVMAAIDPERYEVVPVGITTDGRWVLAEGDPQQWAIADFDPRVAVKANWGLWAVRGKRYDILGPQWDPL